MAKEFPQWFEGIVSDNVKVVAFLRLSMQKGCETSLGGDISNAIVETIIAR